jgi:small conductance mechanosensitive channel
MRDQQAEVLAEEEPTWVRVVGTGDSSVQLRLYFWAADQPTAFKMKTQLLERIKKRFDKEGVEIPYPYRTIVQKKELPKPKKGKKSVKK